MLERTSLIPINDLYTTFLQGGSSQNIDHELRDVELPTTDELRGFMLQAEKSLTASGVQPNLRLLATLTVLKAMGSKRQTPKQLESCLMHTLLLEYIPIHARRIDNTVLAKGTGLGCQFFMSTFAHIALSVLKLEPRPLIEMSSNDLQDLFDGRLFRWVVQVTGRDYNFFPNEIRQLHAKIFPTNRNVHLSESIKGRTSQHITSTSQAHAKALRSSLAPFSHPAFDQHLSSIKISVATMATEKTMSPYKMSREVCHWHNSKKPLAVKGRMANKFEDDKWAARSRDIFARDMNAYAASLTNALGKALKPELIIVGSARQKVQKCTQNVRPDGARASSLLLAESKAQDAWHRVKVQIEESHDLHARLGRVDAYLSGPANKNELDGLRAEIGLYRLFILRDVWSTYCQTNRKAAGIHIAVLIDVALQQLQSGKVQSSKEVKQKLITLAKELGLQSGKPSKAITSRLHIGKSLTKFRLAHEGPYMDRSIGSKEDRRTTFAPDAWQREVLDALDASQSILVVAPTSSGKTFISFYAMEKVLRANDEDVIVYIAPTKALVNQIAAEVQARFTKNYKYGGRSLYAIHTCDYRVNEPTRCQVLVTVPHILQIMLMSPANKDWVPRVKTIIFDEVHSINQTDEGLVWEQLLIMAPCQIIALSATVGNPDSFAAWITSTQSAIGQKFKMIEHEHRFSDLRKYIFVPPKAFEFNGLPLAENLPPLGLEGVEGMKFLHPVCSMTSLSRGVPKDLSLESRDCLMLFETMKRHSTDPFSFPSELYPDVFFNGDQITKSNVINWGSKLKEIIQFWMKSPESPFKKVVEDLSSGLPYFTLAEKQAVSGDPTYALRTTTLVLLCKLRQANALPAILFNYNRSLCEEIAFAILAELMSAEEHFKANDPDFRTTLEAYEESQKAKAAAQKAADKAVKKKKPGQKHDKSGLREADKQAQEKDASQDHRFDNFKSDAPLEPFSFANYKKCEPEELSQVFFKLRRKGIDTRLIDAFQRGIGVHHAGMNLKYRQAVEIWFRRGFLTVVIATGTLSLGINMPCKTVVFAGDSVFLTALNFRQAAGRAGQRGFDLLGNVVFHQISTDKACRLLSSRLPDLNGHFPWTTSFVLRTLALLHGTQNAPYAMKMVNSMLSQPRLYLGGEDFRHQVLHHVRFSIEYLRSNGLVGIHGEPIGLANCVSHLYYAEQGAFAFHALLKGGFFHKLSTTYAKNRKGGLTEPMNVMAHLSGRLPMRPVDKESEKKLIKGSPSVVFLPPLPVEATQVLKSHNQQTLKTYETYVRTFMDQHLATPDNTFPFTKLRIEPSLTFKNFSTESVFPNSAATSIRSSFVALSGHSDTSFISIADLCSTVRDGVFLEKAVVPHLEIGDDLTTPLNAYLYDFCQHGGVKPLEHANRIRKSDLWFYLKDFSLVLATIVTALEEYLGLEDGGGTSRIDIDEDLVEEMEDVKMEGEKKKYGNVPERIAKDHSPSSEISENGKEIINEDVRRELAED